jgi:hypothetical protein
MDMGRTVRIATAMERPSRTAIRDMDTERTSRIALTATARIDRGSEPAMAHIGRGLDTGTRTSRSLGTNMRIGRGLADRPRIRTRRRGGGAEPVGRSVGSDGPS